MRASGSILHNATHAACRLSVKPANPPADDPSCLSCYRAPSANALALAKFIKYAVQQPDVWFVTYTDLVRGGCPVRALARMHVVALCLPCRDLLATTVCSVRSLPMGRKAP